MRRDNAGFLHPRKSLRDCDRYRTRRQILAATGYNRLKTHTIKRVPESITAPEVPHRCNDGTPLAVGGLPSHGFVHPRTPLFGV